MTSRFLWMPLLAFSFFTSVFAQEGLNVAILGRVQSNMMGGDFFVKNFQSNEMLLQKKFTVGYQAGISVGYGFSDNIGVSLGASYVVQSQHYSDYREESNDLVYVLKRTVSLNYVRIPLHITYVTDARDAVSFSAFAGFYYGILMSYEDETTRQYSSSQGPLFDGMATVKGNSYRWEYTDHGAHSLETFTFISQPYRKSDFGLSAGAGIVFKLGNMAYLPVMLAWQQGLSDIKNHSAAETQYGQLKTYWDEISDKNKTEKYLPSSLGLSVGLKILIDEIAGY